VTLGQERLVIAANSNFSGTAAVPTILSSPLGTGTFTFGSGSNNGGGQTVLTDGADRVIVNPMGPSAPTATRPTPSPAAAP